MLVHASSWRASWNYPYMKMDLHALEAKMTSAKIKMIRFSLIALFGFSLAACDNAIFSSTAPSGAIKGSGPTTAAADDYLFINDSFERVDIFEDVLTQTVYGWRGAINDNGTTILGFTGDQVGMEIFSDQQKGPAFDGNRSLYFYGRPGSDVHTMYLVSQAYDLSNYNAAVLSFNYLTLALNDQEDIDTNYIEGIKLQVCNGPLNLCGANEDFIDPNIISISPNWVTIAESNPADNDDMFNGLNQNSSDFKYAQAIVDLNDESIVGDKSTFVFRFAVSMRDGLKQGTPGSGGDDDKDDDKDHDDKYHHGKRCDNKNHGRHYHSDDHTNKCEDKSHGHNDRYDLLSYTNSNSNGNAYGHCIQTCIKGNIGLAAKKACLAKCKPCHKHKHDKKKCEKKHKKKCHHDDDYEPPTESDGSYVDGVILDLVQGFATQRDASELQ